MHTEFTPQAMNEFHHGAVVASAPNPAITGYEGGHLHYVKGRGVRKSGEADCGFCERLGLNDGQWHRVAALEVK